MQRKDTLRVCRMKARVEIFWKIGEREIRKSNCNPDERNRCSVWRKRGLRRYVVEMGVLVVNEGEFVSSETFSNKKKVARKNRSGFESKEMKF